MYKPQSWKGYLRKDGSKGIRNKILVIYTVECASFVAKEVGQHYRYREPDVDVIGFPGCTDNDYAVRMLLAMIRHPNVGAVLTIGLGCEYIQAKLLAEKAEEAGKPACSILIQQTGGTRSSIEAGIKHVEDLAERLKQDTVEVPMDVSDLIIGAECGGSDFTSGLAGNVVVGRFFDRLVDDGGSAIFEEIVEAIGLRDVLVGRGRTDAAKRQLAFAYDKMMDYCRSVKQYSVSPGNFAGGLTTIEEKSMGAVIKSGSRPIEGVIKVSQRPPHNGLWLLDSTPDPHWMQYGYTNPNDNEGLTALASTGAHLLFMVTGRGTVVGSAVAPVIKITGNQQTHRMMQEDIDFGAWPALTGDKTMDELTLELEQLVVDVCGGTLTKSEQLGHKEYYIPYKYQQSNAACER
ncbi:UxaA family hydrolase [Paenibacillus sp.]|uniref:UxaA family hydrolase n=1 Tax=Paenibacillus sp. TaxID=58172 RepID=UPI002D592409|nr:UxaA family hydrolase [Paenibacillus sp.]HZG87476.1 UxaA family hydrolase [Paenibacillus sp.]